MKLRELIEVLGGELKQGSVESEVFSVAAVDRAVDKDIVFAEDTSSAVKAMASRAGAVVLRSANAELIGSAPSKAVIEAAQPRLWFARAAKLLKPASTSGEVHPSAVLGKDVALGADVFIGAGAILGDHVSVGAGTRIEAGAVIGNGGQIGEQCRIYPRAVLYAGVTLHNRVAVHAGAVLGADGFGYVRDALTGAYTQFPQQGALVIEDDVEIGANTTIDRGALAETRIRRGTKIDNLVHVGHNCDIGEDVILVALTGISGSSSVGKGAVIAGQVGIGDHAHVGPGVILGGQAGVLSGKTVTNDGLKPGTVLWGTPARPLQQVLREIAVVGRLARRGSKSKEQSRQSAGETQRED